MIEPFPLSLTVETL